MLVASICLLIPGAYICGAAGTLPGMPEVVTVMITSPVFLTLITLYFIWLLACHLSLHWKDFGGQRLSYLPLYPEVWGIEHIESAGNIYLSHRGGCRNLLG